MGTQTVFAAIIATISLIGIILNTSAIVSLAHKHQPPRSTATMLLIGLCASEIVVSLNYLVESTITAITSNQSLSDWEQDIEPAFACYAHAAISIAGLSISSGFCFYLTVLRYCAVVLNKKYSRQYWFWMLMANSCGMVVIAVFPFVVGIFSRIYILRPMNVLCFVDWTSRDPAILWFLVFLFVGMITPAVFMLYAYPAMYSHVAHTHIQIAGGSAVDLQQSQGSLAPPPSMTVGDGNSECGAPLVNPSIVMTDNSEGLIQKTAFAAAPAATKIIISTNQSRAPQNPPFGLLQILTRPVSFPTTTQGSMISNTSNHSRSRDNSSLLVDHVARNKLAQEAPSLLPTSFTNNCKDTTKSASSSKRETSIRNAEEPSPTSKLQDGAVRITSRITSTTPSSQQQQQQQPKQLQQRQSDMVATNFDINKEKMRVLKQSTMIVSSFLMSVTPVTCVILYELTTGTHVTAPLDFMCFAVFGMNAIATPLIMYAFSGSPG